MHSIATKRRRVVAAQSACLLAMLMLVTFALASKSAAAADVSIETGNFYFCSRDFHNAVCEKDIDVSDTVVWNVVGRHTITECTSDFATCPTTGGFDSGFVTDGQTFSQRFDSPGTYYYHCELHKNEMRGIIVVSAATPSSTPEQLTATETPSVSPTIAALPKTGAVLLGSSTDVWAYALLALGAGLLGGSGLAFAIARKR